MTDFFELFIFTYRFLVGMALIILTYNVLKKLFLGPFKDELDPPDYMIRIRGNLK